ncbi:restriction endonuclease [Candidatus Peregrinibacteria bacterium CG10_big_fil_rev_8_21_14_0_10_54_7]|nr:MAG: restriction endonuclease [Candidatus Peregrinibacteria bacterium CG10_big_fil_rev_8_21_14_0_10_54_7]
MSSIPHERIGEYMKQALLVLKEHGGSLPSKEVLRVLSDRLRLNEYELARYEKSGYVRWESVLHFYSINLKKAGWLRKQKGYWVITPEGEEAAKMSPLDLFNKAKIAYAEWQKAHPKEVEPEEAEEPTESTTHSITLEQSESNATAGIEEYIRDLNAYDFQDLVAALLRAMGFYIPFVAPRGKDGGVDIVAYKDPLGAQPPRIKVQVKHRQEKCGPQTVRELLGVIRKEGEVGLIVSSGGFTTDAIVEMQKSPVHIEAIDLSNLISLWQEHYTKLEEEDKKLLPLRWIAFLDEEE